MFMGADIAEGLSESVKQNRRMSNVFGMGYEDDERATVGCSFKGRRPEGFQDEPEDKVVLELDAVTTELFDCDIVPVSREITGPLQVRVSAEDKAAVFEVVFSADSAQFKQVSGASAYGQVRGGRRPLVELFNEDPPIIHFANGDFLVFNELFELPRAAERVSFDAGKATAWLWKGVDLKKESQGPEKDATSIQRHTLERILGGEFGAWEIVFDGDGKGEVADIVALRRAEDKVSVGLWHCKYSGGEAAGARIGDLYEVCGQAQKCVRWREEPRRMLKHLLHQEDARIKSGKSSRMERGTRTDLHRLLLAARQLTFEYEIFIVQPGLSKAKLAPAFLDVLGATELFLKETYSMPLAVISSP
jgi:hypothetical protein